MLRHPGNVVQTARPGQGGQVVRGHRVRLRLRLVLDDVGGDHAAQPFPDITLVELGGGGDLGTRCAGEGRHRIEQAGLMADAEQQTDGGVVHYAHHAAAEGLGRLRIRSGNIIDDGHLPDGTAASGWHGRNVIHLHIGSGGNHFGAVHGR